jgi:hypothetical protein
VSTERHDDLSNGWPISEPADEADGGWWDPWPVCPDGNPQELRHALGFRERNIGELELRVELGGHDRGVCQLIVDERDDEVFVRVVVCCYDEDDESALADREYLDWPVRVWLERPLGQRAVIDTDTDEKLPLFIPPDYLNDAPQPGTGYRPANPRRRGSEPR